MNTKWTAASTTIGFLVLAAPLFGQPEPYLPGLSLQQNGRAAPEEHLGPLNQASKLLGATVRDGLHQKLGEIDEFIVDLESGRILQVAVSVGGFLGVGERTVAVPPASFTFDSEQRVTLEISKARLRAAPRFELSKWEEFCQRESAVAVYEYYGIQPWFLTPAETGGTTAADPLAPSRFERASKVYGRPVKSPADESVGKLEDLLVDLPGGRVVEVVVAAGGYLGFEDELNPVPPSTLRHTPDRLELVLDAKRLGLADAPRFKKRDWELAGTRQHVLRVYRHFQVQPYFDRTPIAADNTARNAKDRRVTALTPFDQGESESDLEITRDIRRELLKQESLSTGARNVKIITRNGHVTLRGPVSSDEERNAIAEIAARHSRTGNVDNQIEVTRPAKVE